jgi:DNA-binding MarR family transcriptional regulator
VTLKRARPGRPAATTGKGRHHEGAAVATPELATRLHSAAIHLLRLLRREDDASGVSAPLLSALSVLVFGGPRTLGELAAAEQVRPATMSRAVDALAAAGLAERVPDPQDRRVARIRATTAGVRMLKAGQRRRVAALTERLDLLSAGDRKRLQDAVDVLDRVVRQEGVEPAR